MLGPVPADTEVEAVKGSETLLPDVGVAELLDEGVAYPQHLRLTLMGLGDEAVVLKSRKAQTGSEE